jgi:hypothetical protein
MHTGDDGAQCCLTLNAGVAVFSDAVERKVSNA